MIKYILLRPNIEEPFMIEAPDGTQERWVRQHEFGSHPDVDICVLCVIHFYQEGREVRHEIRVDKLESFSKFTNQPEEEE